MEQWTAGPMFQKPTKCTTIMLEAESLGLKLQLEKKQYQHSGPRAHAEEEGRKNLLEGIQKLDLHAEEWVLMGIITK